MKRRLQSKIYRTKMQLKCMVGKHSPFCKHIPRKALKWLEEHKDELPTRRMPR